MKLSDLENFHSIFPDQPDRKSISNFFIFDELYKRYTCILCDRTIGAYHGGKWSHMHYWHKEILK